MDGTGTPGSQLTPSSGSARQCIYCRRGVDESFLYCPYCGRRLSPPSESVTKWRHSTYAVVFGLGTLGPFALPLVWFNPRYTRLRKIALTAVVLALTIVLIYALVLVGVRLIEQIRELTNIY